MSGFQFFTATQWVISVHQNHREIGHITKVCTPGEPGDGDWIARDHEGKPIATVTHDIHNYERLAAIYAEHEGEGKHTPGPWRAVKENNPEHSPYSHWILCGTHPEVNDTVALVGNRGGEDEANARLISKAWLIPELEAALRVAFFYICHLDRSPDGDEELDQISAVLAKLNDD